MNACEVILVFLQEFSAEIERGIISRCNIGFPTTSPDNSQLHSSFIQLSHSLIGMCVCTYRVSMVIANNQEKTRSVQIVLLQ